MICNKFGEENHSDKMELLKTIDESETLRKIVDTAIDEFKKFSNKGKVIVLSVGVGCFAAFFGYGLSKNYSR